MEKKTALSAVFTAKNIAFIVLALALAALAQYAALFEAEDITEALISSTASWFIISVTAGAIFADFIKYYRAKERELNALKYALYDKN